jgi:hypothetical protein
MADEKLFTDHSQNNAAARYVPMNQSSMMDGFNGSSDEE